MKEDKTRPLYGFYRAEVIDNKDLKKFGRVKIWIPSLMPKQEKTKGLWAMPVNNAVGGRNLDGNELNHFAGQCMVPPKGSWIVVFFESGNPNRPFYFGACDLQNTMVLPECQIGSNYENKWVVFKSHKGRCIVISDDPDDCRVEITGTKRTLSGPPTGGTDSVYTIDGNQTTILINEINGAEKVLVRTHKGDFVNIDTENRKLQISFASDFEIMSKGGINIKSTDNINIKSAGDINIQAGGKVNIKSGNMMCSESGLNMNLKAGLNLQSEAAVNMSLKAGVNMQSQAGAQISELASAIVSLDGSSVLIMQGASQPAPAAQPAGSAKDANPVGDR